MVFFKAIQEQDTEAVRRLLVDYKTDLTSARFKPESQTVKFPAEIERDAYTLLGAYLGPLTGLQFSILTGQDGIAKDILDSTFEQGKNTLPFMLWYLIPLYDCDFSKSDSSSILTFFSISAPTEIDIDARFGVSNTFGMSCMEKRNNA